VVRRGDLVIAIATGGRSPALARRLRERLEGEFGPEWAEALRVLHEARERTLPQLPTYRERADAWRGALDPEELLDLVRAGRAEEARDRLIERLVGGATVPASPSGRGIAR
jgi:precorrin-2 dehydrogenase/sirohydrochlorin ferrochelatase